jgi:carnitine-CoA ligase
VSICDTLGQELRQAAAAVPERPFIRMMAGEWTYRQVDEASDRLASVLASRGVGKGATVSLMLPNCIEFVICWFAIARLGGIAAPVNTSFRGPALEMAVNLVQSRLMVVHATLFDHFQEVRGALTEIGGVIVVGEAATVDSERYETLMASAGVSTPFEEPRLQFSDLCLLLYTSGTTGRSKAAMISHRFVLGQAQGVIEGLGLTPRDVLYCPYPLFHLDAAVMTLAPALLLRGVAAIGERFSVSSYWDEMKALGGTVFDFMGATLTMLWKQPPSQKDRDHQARLGWGVPLPAWAPEFERRFGCRLVELYGCTEAGAFIYTPLDAPRRRGSCGKALDRWEVQIQDESGNALPAGEIGELVVRPREPSLIMQGYFGMPEASLDVFRDLWFHTGDLLRQDEDGYLYFVGRRKDVVRRRGENISAAEVEMGIEAHADVLECAVIGVPSELTEEDVMACIVPRPGTSIDFEALVRHCTKSMAKFMVPRYFRVMDGLPKTPTDKVEKFRLQQQGVTANTWDREKKGTR